MEQLPHKIDSQEAESFMRLCVKDLIDAGAIDDPIGAKNTILLSNQHSEGRIDWALAEIHIVYNQHD